jgi:hypothetical protein
MYQLENLVQVRLSICAGTLLPQYWYRIARQIFLELLSSLPCPAGLLRSGICAIKQNPSVVSEVFPNFSLFVFYYNSQNPLRVYSDGFLFPVTNSLFRKFCDLWNVWFFTAVTFVYVKLCKLFCLM